MTSSTNAQSLIWRIKSAIILLGFILTSCSGGDGSQVTTIPLTNLKPALTPITGTASVGVPIVNANIVATCANGTSEGLYIKVTTTTDLNGNFTINPTANCFYPIALTLNGGLINNSRNELTFRDIIFSGTRENVTSLTEFLVQIALDNDLAANGNVLKLTQDDLQQALATEAADFPVNDFVSEQQTAVITESEDQTIPLTAAYEELMSAPSSINDVVTLMNNCLKTGCGYSPTKGNDAINKLNQLACQLAKDRNDKNLDLYCNFQLLPTS